MPRSFRSKRFEGHRLALEVPARLFNGRDAIDQGPDLAPLGILPQCVEAIEVEGLLGSAAGDRHQVTKPQLNEFQAQVERPRVRASVSTLQLLVVLGLGDRATTLWLVFHHHVER